MHFSVNTILVSASKSVFIDNIRMVNVSYEELAETKSQPLPSNATLEALKQMREAQCSTSASRDFSLQPNQRFLRRVMSPESPTRNLLMVHGTGQGKCHGLGTQILMFDGSIKLVQHIVEGDMLMGDDSTPRTVLSLARGTDEMYEISSTKGTKYTANSEHILCLKYTGQQEVSEIEVRDFLKLSKKIQRNLKGYKVPVEFPAKKIDFDPYILGVWLGDGSKRDPVISSQDSQILIYLREFCRNNNARLTYQSGYEYRISSISKNHENVFLAFLKKYNLINNKHIPDVYKFNTRSVRLQVLAGLIDTDGYLTDKLYEITQKSEQLSNDIVFLARSLGFATTTILSKKSCMYKGERKVGYYYRTNIYGFIDEIPVKILRKKSEPRYHNKDPLKYGITIKSIGRGNYYGFTLDGNNRYVLGDFSVTHNTCTAIQIAEEYIVRPEFQDKRVLVLANPSIQENFKTQIFDISRVSVDADGLLLSKQCTGRRYLDMIQRSQSESLRYTDKASQQRVMNLANKIIGEFYEFVGYLTFANIISTNELRKTPNEVNKWIHETFDNRLIIIDEAHNLKETTESESNKLVAIAIEKIVKTAVGVTLVLLTATPMYDTFDEILYYFNLFLWNERKIESNKLLKPSDIFTEAGDFKEGQEQYFRKWCQDYVSFVRGENPFTFPFRLPPPNSLIALPDRTTDIKGQPIKKQRKYLTLTLSFVSPVQEAAIKDLSVKAVSDSRLICVYPENKSFRETFEKSEGSYKYRSETFLSPSKVALYSSKFGLIMNTIQSTSGIVFVYSNVVESGAQLFAMCLEEHGFEPASGNRLLKETSEEVKRGSNGKYVLFTSDISDSEIKKALVRLKRPENVDGSDIRIVIASPKVSEGVDFRNVRQIHVLDPWFNMSRIEQVLGRGMRTCSHSTLPFEEQNCTIYLHVCRYPNSTQETVDEYIYRTFVEEKGVRIAKVKRVVMESAMDCELQLSINSLPADWRGKPRPDGSQFLIPQNRNGERVELPLSAMSAPTFEDGSYEITCKVEPAVPDPDHERPLSAILDVKDEVMDKVLKLFAKKPIWKRDALFNHTSLKQYTPSVLLYILKNAIDSGFELKDKNGRIGHLQAKDGVFAFTIGDNDTLLDRLLQQDKGVDVVLPTFEATKVEEAAPVAPVGFSDISAQRESHPWPPHIKERFSAEVLDWHYVDIVMTDSEKINHLLNLNWSSPPIYAAPLITKTSDNKALYILGSKKIYNHLKEKIVPVGAEEDAYRNWVKELKDSFVTRKADLFASIKDGGMFFTLDPKSSTIERVKRSKVIVGRQCTSYESGTLDRFSEWLAGAGFPEKVKTKKDRCLFLDLLVREAILSKKDGIFFLTPEQFSVLDDDDNRPDVLKRLKE